MSRRFEPLTGHTDALELRDAIEARAVVLTRVTQALVDVAIAAGPGVPRVAVTAK